MTRTRLLLIMIAVLLSPAQAHAALGFWGWLEELSGPGPFKGGGVSLPVASVDPKTDSLKWFWQKRVKPEDQEKQDVPDVRHAFRLNLGVFNSDSDPARFSDLDVTAANNQGRVRLWSVTGLYVFRMRVLDVGTGGGVWVLSGDGFDPIKKLALTPISATLKPFVKWPKSGLDRLRFEFETTYIPQGFKGADFGNGETQFNSGLELVNRIGIVVDF